MADFPDADKELVESIVSDLFNKPNAVEPVTVPEHLQEPLKEAITNYKVNNPGKDPKTTTSGDVASIVKGTYSKYQAASEEALSVERRVGETIRGLLGAEAKTYALKGESDAMAINELGKLEIDKATAAKRASAAYGLDMSKPENIVVAAGAEVQRSFGELQKKYAERTKLANVTPLDGPLEFIGAQFKLKFQEPGLKAEEERFKALNNVAAQAQARVANQDAIEVANIGTTTAARTAALADSARATAQILGTKAQVEAEKTYQHVAQAAVQYAGVEVQRAIQLLSLEDRRLAREDASLDRSQRTELLEQAAQDRKAAKTAATEAENNAMSEWRTAAAVFGVGIPEGTTTKTVKNVIPKHLLPAVQDAMGEQGTGGGRYGKTPMDAIHNVTLMDQKFVAQDLRTAFKAVDGQVMVTQNELEAQAKATGGSAKDVKRNDVNKAVLEKYDAYSLNITSTDNPYTARTKDLVNISAVRIQPYYQELKAFQETKLHKSLALELQNNPAVAKLPVERTMQIAVDMVNGGQITQAEAAKEVALYYKAAAAYNNATFMYDKFNLPQQEGYKANVVLRSSGLKTVLTSASSLTSIGLGLNVNEAIQNRKLPTNITIDLTKPADVQQVLVKRVASAAALKMSQDVGVTPNEQPPGQTQPQVP